MDPEKLTSPREVKSILNKHDLRPRKRLGQNFLVDKNILNKIVASADLSSRDTVIEIGSGLGTLTQALSRQAKKVIAIEIDRKLCEISREILRDLKNVELVPGNILKIDLNRLLRRLSAGNSQSLKVVSNLPYYLSTSILSRLLENKKYFKVILISLQKEVGGRLGALPGTKDYGILSLAVQYHTQPEILFSISGGCFFPQPQVDSSLVKLKVLSEPRVKVKNEEFLFILIKAAFSQRRKIVLNTLQSKLKLRRELLLEIFKELSLDPGRRAETFSLEEFARLANALKK